MRRVRLSDAQFKYDPEDPAGFKSGMARFGREVDSKDTGATLYELPPGEAVCPYHYEYGEEEWALVIEGTPSARTPEGTEQLEPHDLVFFPKGPEGAHQIRNDSDAPALVLMWSTVVLPDRLRLSGQRQGRRLDGEQGGQPDGQARERRRVLRPRERLTAGAHANICSCEARRTYCMRTSTRSTPRSSSVMRRT